MGSQMTEAQTLHATLCEIERGLFHVVYRMDGKAFGQHALPRYEVGTCASDARSRVERHAQACGYNLIVWDEAVEMLPIHVSVASQDIQLRH